MGHEEVPFGKGELGVTGGETGAEVVLPGLGGTFGCIVLVAMRWYSLEGNVVFLESLLEFIGAFIVENVEFGGISVRLECMQRELWVQT